MTAPPSQTQLVIDWLTSLGWDTRQELGYPLLAGPLILDEPDRSVWITLSGGAGWQTDEGAADAWNFQAFTRGTADDQAGAEQAALLLDQLILGAGFPCQVDGVAVQHAHRVGAPPTPLPVEPDLRHAYTCSYTIITGV